MSIAGDVVHMRLADHVAQHPDCPGAKEHIRQLAELANQGDDDMTKRGGRPPKYDDDQARRARNLTNDGKTAAEVGQLMGIPAHAVPYLLVRADRLNGNGHEPQDDRSLRSTLLDLIQERGPIEDSRDLSAMVRATGRAASLHEIHHILGQLKRQGELSMVDHTEGTQRWYGAVTLVGPKILARSIVGNGDSVQVEPVDLGVGNGHEPLYPGAPDPGYENPFRLEDPTEPQGPDGNWTIAQAEADALARLEPDRVNDQALAFGFTSVAAAIEDPVHDAYPLTRELMSRSIALRAAARLLESAGQDELALATLERVDDYSPLEREAIAMYQALKAEGDPE